MARKIDELDRRVSKNDAAIVEIIEAIRQLMAPPSPKMQGRTGVRFLGCTLWTDFLLFGIADQVFFHAAGAY